MRAWQGLLEQENWGRLPHYALGGSSGGAFAMLLAQRVTFDGVCPIAAFVQPHTLDTRPKAPDFSRSWQFPPTFFVFMERDELTAEGVASNIAVLKKQVKTSIRYVKHVKLASLKTGFLGLLSQARMQGALVNDIAVRPKPLHVSFFSERIPAISNETSSLMYAALLAEGCLNATGYLVDNPR